jgi:hypothetical protein
MGEIRQMLKKKEYFIYFQMLSKHQCGFAYSNIGLTEITSKHMYSLNDV